MNLVEAARSGAGDIWANKFRSALSFSAVSVGVASLLYTLGQTRGMQLDLRKDIELMGPGRLTVEQNHGSVSRGLSKGLTLEDAEAIRAEVPGLYMIDPHATSWGKRLEAAGRQLRHVQVDGESEDWRKRDWVYELRGRFIDSRDVVEAARVCVLVRPGNWRVEPFWAKFWWRPEPIQDLIDHFDLLGKPVSIEDREFTVVGILRSPPLDLDPRRHVDDNPEIIVPITSYLRYIERDGASSHKIDEIRIDTGDERTISDAQRRISALLNRRHRGEDDFKLRDIRQETAGEMEELKHYVVVGLALGLVALLAGGIGIMNVTLATIFSRIKEIGIRRAVGAGRGDILAQFLLEAAFLGSAGGVAGLGLGLAGMRLLARWAERDVSAVAWYHGVGLVLLGAAVSAGFAFFPAWQAANLDPVEALRNE